MQEHNILFLLEKFSFKLWVVLLAALADAATENQIISLHAFPKDENVRRKLVKLIQMTGSECSRGGGWMGP